MCPDIMEEVSGYQFTNIHGILKGYCRLKIKGEIYPAIVPDKGDSVEGVVYKNIPRIAWSRLDRFEGKLYKRKAVMINLDNGSCLKSETYVLRPEFLSILEHTEWNFNDFLKNEKDNFICNYRGFSLL
jgi:hypothetical protein